MYSGILIRVKHKGSIEMRNRKLFERHVKHSV